MDQRRLGNCCRRMSGWTENDGCENDRPLKYQDMEL